MYRGRTTIREVMNLPNSIYLSLLHIKRKELENENKANEESSELMKEHLEGG